jgi:hypothetical protein
VECAFLKYKWKVIGIPDGFDGLDLAGETLDAGLIALEDRITGGAHVILIP